MIKEIFKELEDQGEFINLSYFDTSFFLVIRKDKYEKIKQDFTEKDWTGYND